MKKRLAVLGTLGVGAGVFLALKNRGSKTDGDAASNDKSVQQSTSVKNTSDASSTGSTGHTTAARTNEVETEPVIDDQGTDQAGASQILRDIRDEAFDSSDEKLALALGRPTEEIRQWIRGEGIIDGDVVMKARALAIERLVEI